MNPAKLRAATATLVAPVGVSQRRACRVSGTARSTQLGQVQIYVRPVTCRVHDCARSLRHVLFSVTCSGARCCRPKGVRSTTSVSPAYSGRKIRGGSGTPKESPCQHVEPIGGPVSWHEPDMPSGGQFPLAVDSGGRSASRSYTEQLDQVHHSSGRDFLRETMDPRTYYQPLIIAELISAGGVMPKKALAERRLVHDGASIAQAERVLIRWPRQTRSRDRKRGDLRPQLAWASAKVRHSELRRPSWPVHHALLGRPDHVTDWLSRCTARWQAKFRGLDTRAS